MKSISVIGSCVCRDLFEKDNGENFSFFTDIRFSSPISMLSSPVDFIKADFNCFQKNVPTVNGNWYKKNLINDINKTAFEALREKHGEYLVLDFAESRISLANIKWNDKNAQLLVSNSVSFRAHYSASLSKNIFKDTSLEIINPLEYSDEFWKQTILDFSKELLKIFSEDKIILVKNKPGRLYLDASGLIHPYYSKDHFDSIMLCDILLDKLYDWFVVYCPKCVVIDIPQFALGDQKHKWGNHPFHFFDIYYEYLLNCIKAVVLENNKKLIPNLFNKYSMLFKEKYTEARLKTSLEKSQKSFSVLDILSNYEEFNSLGKKQKTIILFALDKKNFIKNFRRIKKGK